MASESPSSSAAAAEAALGANQDQNQKRFVYTSTRTSSSRSKIIKSQRYRVRDSSLPPLSCSRKTANESTPTTTTGSRNTDRLGKVEDSICEPTPIHLTSRVMLDNSTSRQHSNSGAVMRRQTRQASLSYNDLQQQRQYHDNNNNNNNNANNGSKVRLLITPATTTTTTDNNNNYGSKQQMVRSATIDWHQQQRSQQQQPIWQQQNSRQKNYHHYDYYTDSDLTSPTTNQQQANHYDENILLFATEHNNNHSQSQSQSQSQRSTTTTTNGNQQQRLDKQHLHSAYNNQVNYQVDGGRPLRATPTSSNQLHYYGIVGPTQMQTNTGKFVNYYPSSRQTQSPTTSHYQNYSFHVPLATHFSHHQTPISHHHHQQQQQSRYGFVAPADRAIIRSPPANGSRSSFNQSFRSRTISHIPNMVKVSVEDAVNHQSNRNPLSSAADSGGGGAEYQDFYDRPSIATKQYMLSEGDLLKVHRVDLGNSNRWDGWDNPFKPGTELSWEADMMVRLMKRGYPVKELPVLVQTAKQVALEKSSPVAPSVDSYTRSRSMAAESNHAPTNVKAKSYMMTSEAPRSGEGKKQQPQQELAKQSPGKKATKQQFNAMEVILQRAPSELSCSERKQCQNNIGRRQSSSTDISSGKQIWANSLSRTKSMPRFTMAPDADSIDQLITSIENEMSDLLSNEENQPQKKQPQQGLKKRTSLTNSVVETSSAGGKTGIGKAAGLQAITIVPNNSSNNNKTAKMAIKKKKVNNQTSSEQQQVAVKNRKLSGSSQTSNNNNDKQQQQVGSSSDSASNPKADLIRKETKKGTQCCIIQ